MYFVVSPRTAEMSPQEGTTKDSHVARAIPLLLDGHDERSRWRILEYFVPPEERKIAFFGLLFFIIILTTPCLSYFRILLIPVYLYNLPPSLPPCLFHPRPPSIWLPPPPLPLMAEAGDEVDVFFRMMILAKERFLRG